MKEVVITSAARTPVGSLEGVFKTIPAVELGAIAAKKAIKRTGIEPDQVEEAVIDNVLQAGLGQDVARQVVLDVGYPITIPTMTLNRVCGSGLRAVSLAAQMIRAGDVDAVLASGTESTLCSPYVIPDARWGAHMNDKEIIDEMIKDNLWDAFNNYRMGITAEDAAKKYNIAREMQDQLTIVSQNRAERACAESLFNEEIVPVEVRGRRETKVVDKDERIRDGVTLGGISSLKPAFLRDGSGAVTAANTSGANDGATMLVIMSEEKAEELGVKPLATIVNYASTDVDPTIMGTGPIPSSRKALEKSGWEIKDVDLIEANEAFAAQASAVTQELQLGMDKVNVNGGAVAIDHPIGTSGARILTTLLYATKYRDAKKGLAALCIGDSMGTALTVERG